MFKLKRFLIASIIPISMFVVTSCNKDKPAINLSSITWKIAEGQNLEENYKNYNEINELDVSKVYYFKIDFDMKPQADSDGAQIFKVLYTIGNSDSLSGDFKDGPETHECVRESTGTLNTLKCSASFKIPSKKDEVKKCSITLKTNPAITGECNCSLNFECNSFKITSNESIGSDGKTFKYDIVSKPIDKPTLSFKQANTSLVWKHVQFASIYIFMSDGSIIKEGDEPVKYVVDGISVGDEIEYNGLISHISGTHTIKVRGIDTKYVHDASDWSNGVEVTW